MCRDAGPKPDSGKDILAMKDKTAEQNRDIGQLVRTATQSHIDVDTFYSPGDLPDLCYEKDLGDPGQYPYTRGLYQDMYRARLWLKSFIVSYATAEETNEAFRHYFASGMNDLRLGGDLTGAGRLGPGSSLRLHCAAMRRPIRLCPAGL